MVPAKLLTLQVKKKADEMVEKLRSEVPQNLLQRAICDVNDSLTSILAISDSEAPQTVPKIKECIKRINQSLQALKGYQSAKDQKGSFNINAVTENILNVVQENFQEGLKISRLMTEIKARCEGDQSDFEGFLLYLLVYLAQSTASEKSEILIELRQKGNDAMITILKDHCALEGEQMEDIEEHAGKVNGIFKITPQGKGIEIILRIPLIFETTPLQGPTQKSSIKLGPWIMKKEEVAEEPPYSFVKIVQR
ncbi:MAG: hypothetical protein V1760_03380 [Candidatus Peregrinibacteria bacterium]